MPTNEIPTWTSTTPIVCSWCKRVQDADGQYTRIRTESENAVASHSICDDCMAIALAKLDEEEQTN